MRRPFKLLVILATAICAFVVVVLKNGLPLALLETIQDTTVIPEFSQEAEEVDSALAEDYSCFFDSDAFNDMSQTCCRSLYIPPRAQSLLPLNLSIGPPKNPASMGLPTGTRFRYLVGNRNEIVFDGANAESVDFINHYFGFNIQLAPDQSQTFLRMQHAELLGDADLFNPHLVGLDNVILQALPSKLDADPKTTSVAISSLPPESVALYANSDTNPTNSPAFVIPYCETTDPSGALNQGLPMKVAPSSCPDAEKIGMACSCGRLVFFGFPISLGARNHWLNSFVSLDSLALSACAAAAPPPPPPPTVMEQPPPPPTAADLDPCSQKPDYDAAAQKWYYWTPVDGGGKVKMVRHWCQSEFEPQEAWYAYQRYLPRSRNNFPAPPINDFDLLNVPARDYLRGSLAERRREGKAVRFDDFLLGNSASPGRGNQARAPADDWTLGNSAVAAAAAASPPPPPAAAA